MPVLDITLKSYVLFAVADVSQSIEEIEDWKGLIHDPIRISDSVLGFPNLRQFLLGFSGLLERHFPRSALANVSVKKRSIVVFPEPGSPKTTRREWLPIASPRSIPVGFVPGSLIVNET